MMTATLCGRRDDVAHSAIADPGRGCTLRGAEYSGNNADGSAPAVLRGGAISLGVQPMATTVHPSDSIDVLDLPMRVHNACRRNHVSTVGDLLEVSEPEFLRFRYCGEGALRDVKARLARHGLSMPSEEPPPLDPSIVAGARWVGRQLDVLVEDDRVLPKNRLGGIYRDGPAIENRRRAWAFYRWGTAPEAEWPRDGAGGYGWMAVPMPGSMELHLEGLNRLAHEELDA